MKDNSHNLKAAFILVLALSVSAGCSMQHSFSSSQQSQETSSNSAQNSSSEELRTERTVKVNVDSQEHRPTVKVVLVVDNSNSMLDEQATLSSGIKRAVDNLKGFNLDFLVYTTTSESSQSSQRPTSIPRTLLFLNNESQTSIPVAPNPAAASYIERILFPLSSAYSSSGQKLEVRSTMSDAEFEGMSLGIKQSVQVGTNGSDRESGLCTIGRLLADEGPAAPFEQGDKAAFVILSDADDSSNVDTCLSQTEQDYNPNTAIITASSSTVPATATDAQRYDYSLNFNNVTAPASYALKYTYASMCTVDGQLRPCSQTSSAVSFDPTSYGNPAEGSNRECAGPLLSYAQSLASSAGRTVTACTYSSSKPSVQCKLNDLENLSKNLLTQSFTLGGTTHANFEAYCRATMTGVSSTWTVSSPTRSARKLAAYVPSGSRRNSRILDAIAPGKASLAEGVAHKSKALFGEQGFFVSAIIADRDSGCIEGIESEAIKYRSFAENLDPDSAVIHPICSSDYTPALRPVEEFINRVVSASYQIGLESGEKIIDVEISRLGALIRPAVGSDYTISGGTIQFRDGYLQTNDQLEVTVEKVEKK